MPNAARLYDSITGITSGEHCGHIPAHEPEELTGEISDEVAATVFINGLPAAMILSVTTEHDSCCITSYGEVAEGSTTVFIEGRKAARLGDALNPHDGEGEISSGSPDVFIGG